MLKGTVRNGTVVFEPGIDLPDGAEVRVELPPTGEAMPFRSLADELSLDDALEKLYLLYKINRGIRQADAGQTVSHEEARERLKKWLE